MKRRVTQSYGEEKGTMGVRHRGLARGEGRRRLALAMLVAVLLLAVLALAMATGFPHKEVLWMYIESTKPTVQVA